MNTVGVFLSLTQCSLFKDVPWLLKPLFWFDTNSTNNAMLNKQLDSDSESQLGVYVIDDALFYENLIETSVSISDSDYAGAFRFYHLNGMHVPIEVNENAQKVELDVSDDIEQCGLGGQNIINQGLGNFTIINEYINQLRNLGLYDNTAILITADHGISMVGETERWYTMPPSIDNPATPIFLYKPAQTPEEAAVPLAFSDAPIGHEEFIPTILNAIGADSSAYGNAVFEIAEGDERTRYSYMTLSDGNGRAIAIRKYSIHGDVADLNNWEYTGDEWEITSW